MFSTGRTTESETGFCVKRNAFSGFREGCIQLPEYYDRIYQYLRALEQRRKCVVVLLCGISA